MRFRRRADVFLCVAFAISRVVIFLAGVRMRGDIGTPQLLDPQNLEHDLWSSLWHLHSHPPLLNVFMGILLKFPDRFQMTVASICSMLLGLGMVLTTFFLCLELGLRRALCIGIPLIVILGPDYILYENFLFYAYATAAGMLFAALSLLKYLRGHRWSWGFAYAMSLAALALMNSAYQWPYFVLGLLPLVLVDWRARSHFLKIAAVPLLLVVLWYGKNVLLFRTYSTTSLSGMNLAKPVLLNASQADVRAMVEKGQIGPIAAVYPFQGLDAYVPSLVAPHRPTGVTVLDAPTKSAAGLGNPNYNNLDYIKISNLYLAADLKFLREHPFVLIPSAWKALRIFDLPADQYYVVGFDNRQKIAGYANLFDRWVLLQIKPMLDGNFTYEAWAGRTPDWTQASWTRAFIFGATLLVLPLMLRRRGIDRAVLWTLVFIVVTCWYTVIFTSVSDLGENNRFSFSLGTLPLVGSAYALGQRGAFGRHRRKRILRSSAASPLRRRAARPRPARGGK